MRPVSAQALIYGGSGCAKVEMTRNDAKRMEGTCHSTEEQDKNSEGGADVDVKFAVDL